MKGLIFLCFFLLPILGACSKYDPKDLKQYVAKLEQRPVPVETLSEFKRYKPVSYEAYKYHSPFVPFIPSTVTKRKEGEVVTALELYPLSELTMVGTLSDRDTIWALVRIPTGAVYQITTGQNIGTMDGRVVKIEAQAMMVEETFVDAAQGSSMKQDILPLKHGTASSENLT